MQNEQAAPEKQYDVITFGETMLRLSPPNHARLEMSDSLDFRVGGSESNTAVALARLGRRVSWWSKLPDNPLGRKIAAELARWGVDTRHIRWVPNGRVGIYYVEYGTPPRGHQVHYDRMHSAMSTLNAEEVDWSVLDAARHLHVTGITCAITRNCANVVDQSVREARQRGLTVSLDVNYRSKLWTGGEARRVLGGLMPNVDLLFCPLGDASTVFGVHGSPTDVAKRLQQMHRVQSVVVTGNSQHVAAVSGTDVLRADVVSSREVDRIGAGDAGDAGILHGFLDGDLPRGLKFGCAMAALKQTIPGDMLIASLAEIERVVSGAGHGIQR